MSIRSFRLAKAFVVIGLCLLASTLITAQSGRRLPKGSPAVATPTPTPELATESKKPPKPDHNLRFVSDIPLAGPSRLISPQSIHSWTLERLRRSSLVEVKDSGSMNRRDAIKLAKSESESYVVLVELRNDMFSGTSARASTIVLTVYNPVTAKVKVTRSLSVGQNSTRLPGSQNLLYTCYPGIYGDQILLLEASIEAADAVFNSFSIPVPPLCRNSGK